MTFIFSFFMAGLTGYYFGVYFMGLEFIQVTNVLYVEHDRVCSLHNGNYNH